MNFFEQQDHARKQTRILVLLFTFAVITIVMAVNLVMALLWILTQGQPLFGAHHYPYGFFFTNTIVTVILICGGTLLETFNLREGGEAVARMAGGRLVAINTRDADERRLINVVEEMAIASGIVCPKVYLLDKESSINAFAAGYNPNEAVVALTQGALKRLTRDELQGVVGHEFSHILNGDMSLNLRLVGVLFGIEMVGDFGRKTMEVVMYSSADGAARKLTVFHVTALVFGATFFVVGYIGLFFARLIKSAVSRQREFLADASAIQFTRNPDGLGSALRKIGGLNRKSVSAAHLEHRNAELLSHFFLSAVRPNLMAGFFATHPPLRERLRRIYGREVAMIDAHEIPAEEWPAPAPSLPDIHFVASPLAEMKSEAHLSDEAIIATATQAYGAAIHKIRLSSELDHAAHDTYTAPLLVYALLLNIGQQTHTQQSPQLQCLMEFLPKHVTKIEQLATAITRLPPNARLPLLDLAMPALRQLPIADREAMLAQFERMVASDKRVSLNEFVLQTVLTRRLAARAARAVKVKYSAVTELRAECQVLFSLLAHVASPLMQQSAQVLFMRAADFSPTLLFSKSDLIEISALSYGRVKNALDKANQLAPLANPALIKSLLAVAGEHASLPLPFANLLRAICAALEAPMPPAVAAVYSVSGWPDASLS